MFMTSYIIKHIKTFAKLTHALIYNLNIYYPQIKRTKIYSAILLTKLLGFKTQPMSLFTYHTTDSYELYCFFYVISLDQIYIFFYR